MARVTVEEVRALAERTKLKVETMDTELLNHYEGEILARLGAQIDAATIATWLGPDTTPKLVRTIIARKYFAWFYFRQYSEDVGPTENTYAVKLDASAEMLLVGILDGSIIIPEVPTNISGITFYPTDASTATDPKDVPSDPSVGPASFSMTTTY
jgi:hypothetical protein